MAFISLQFDSDQIRKQFQNLGALCNASFSAAADSTNIEMNAKKEKLADSINKINSEIENIKTEAEQLHSLLKRCNNDLSIQTEKLDALEREKFLVDDNLARELGFGSYIEGIGFVIDKEKREKAKNVYSYRFYRINDLDAKISDTKKTIDLVTKELNTALEKKKQLEEDALKKEAEKANDSNNLAKIKDDYPDKPFYPFPNSLAELIKNDTHLKTQFNNINAFIEALPCITIRSYFITTAMMEVLTNIINVVNFGWAQGENLLTGNFSELKETGNKFKTIFKALASSSGLRLFFEKLVKNVSGLVSDKETDIRLYQLCEALYYRLATTTHNNTFYLPCEIKSGFFDSASEGWDEPSHFPLGSAGGAFFQMLKQTNGLDVMPTFNVVKVNSNTERLDISLDLINDTRDAAISNTILIRTLIICNKWVQCGVIQLPGNLYDVSIPGTGQRWFMCTAEISVTNKGALRLIENVNAGELKGLSPSELKEFRIPDAYSLNISFNSLIPNNLNNFLLAKAADGQIFMNKRTVLSELISNFHMINSAADDASAAIAETPIAKINNITELDNLKSEILNDIYKADPNSLAVIAYNAAYDAAEKSILGSVANEKSVNKDDVANMAATIAKERVLAEIENRRAALIKP